MRKSRFKEGGRHDGFSRLVGRNVGGHLRLHGHRRRESWTLRRPGARFVIPAARQPSKLPHILSREELVREVEIPKRDGGMRSLGIPTVTDRIAQTVVKIALEPEVEPQFHPDSYGYRPGKSAVEALGKARCHRREHGVRLLLR